MSAKQLSSSGVLYTDRRDFYIRPNIVKELWTDVTPFTTVISNRGVVSGLADPTYKMFEHRNPWQKQQFTIAEDSVAVADNNSESAVIDVSTPIGLNSAFGDSYVGLVVEIWNSALSTKRGVFLVTFCDSTPHVKLRMLSKSDTVGGIGDDGTANNQSLEYTSVNGDIAIVVGNAHEEGGTAPEAWADELEVVYNQCQIFKTPLQITGTLLEASLRGESSELARLRDQKSQEHKIQKERAFLYGMHPWNLSGGFSSLESIAGTNGPIRTTMGIIPAIENNAKTGDDQNNFTISEASYSYGAFVDDMEKVFHYVPEAGSKRAFVGAGALGYFSKMSGASGLAGNSGWTVSLGDMKRDGLGFNYRMLETPHGMLQLIPTPSLRGPYNKSMVVVSDENLSLMQYRAPKFQANIKTDNAYDGVKDQYFSDEGIGLTLIESHKLFKITD